MELNAVKKFGKSIRKKLKEQIDQRLSYVLGSEDEYSIGHAREIETLHAELQKKGKEQFLEEVAYTWFNRIAALQFMDCKGYNSKKVVSPAPGETQPHILSCLKRGEVPKEVASVKDRINAYLDGKITSSQPDREAYRTALLAVCNSLGELFPFLFKKVDDWYSLLLPTDLLSPQSILADFQREITETNCKDVEIIGWLYQFYIAEKKDQIFAAMRKNKKIGPDEIPAATQLFTPHWIVRYMVENSLGRLWLNNFPESKLRERMDYIVETDTEEDYIKIRNPEEIKLLDPACGSGHILVYAFDLLYLMYEEEGYTPSDIPALILANNLYGIDIDERAAELAAFSLVMKAREKDRFLFKKNIRPNVIACKAVDADLKEAGIRMSPDLQGAYSYLKDAKVIGSLLPVDTGDPSALQEEISDIRNELDATSNQGLFQAEAADQVKAGLTQIEYLLPRYHCVVTNPPYMGGKGMDQKLKDFVKKHYPISKSDLFAVFMEKCLELLVKNGYMGMINQQSWMFLSSYEALREKIIEETEIITMAHLGARAFDTIGGEVVSTTMFVIENTCRKEYKGCYFRLVEESGESKKAVLLKESIKEARLQMSGDNR